MASIFGLSSALATLTTIFDHVASGEGNGMELVEKLNKKYDLITSNGSITKLLSNYIVEPVILATYDARESEVFDSVSNLNTDIFTSFYMQAFQVLTNQMDIDARTAVNLLSTDSSAFSPKSLLELGQYVQGKKALAGVVGGAAAAVENYNYLEILNNPKNKFLKVNFASEGPFDQNEEPAEVEIPLYPDNIKRNDKIYQNKDLYEIEKHPLYAVQTRNLNLEISIDYKSTAMRQKYEEQGKEPPTQLKTIVIPIIIKAHIIVLGVQDIINALKPNSRTKSLSYRIDEWRAGAISFKDLIFCSDLIRDYKDVKKKDRNSIVELINARNLNANLNTIYGAKGFESNYNMIICTTNDKVKIDKAMNGDIFKEGVKQKFLADMHAIGCTVLDEDYERLSILIKDIRSRSDVGYKAIQKRKPGSAEQDLIKMTQALLMNKQLVF